MIDLVTTVRRRRRPLVGAAAVASALALAACGGSTQGGGGGGTSAGTGTSPKLGASSTGGKPVSGGVLTAAIPSDPTTLDWGINTDALTIDIAQNVFELLFAADKDWQVKPELATGYTLSSDKKVYTIGLRQGVHFQNGQLMTSADVVASLDRWVATSGTGEALKPSLVSIKPSGKYKVVVTLNKPQYSFITDLASIVQAAIVIPANIAKAAGKKELTDSQIIGTGPYKLAKYVHGQYIQLTKYTGYKSRTENWGGMTGKKVAYIPTIKFKIVSDDTVRLDGVQTGQWQFADGLTDDDYSRIQAQSSTTVPEAESASLIEYLLINNGTGPFKSLKAREALNMLLNKKALAESSLGPDQLWSPQHGQFALPSNKAMYTTDGASTFARYSPSEAKKLFAQAGITSKTPLTMLSTQTYPNYYSAAQTIQSELKQIGITLKIETYDFPTMISKLSQQPSSWDLSMTSFAGQPLDPAQVTFLTSTWPGGFKSPQIDAAEAKYEQSTTAAQAKTQVGKIQGLVWSQLPDIGIGEQVLLDAASTKLKDYGNFTGEGFWNAYLAK